ncbi:tRNA threonylcarbamoyl adenosine modification protein [Streptococcus equinus ATCC 33317]|uniref:L-threonylcarbamoyladenylate synthase n=1 Tax=Streptococcus equinus TaxID=1335 RepID=UPI00050313B6|nr:L-threonylcarbamoyladenylate synthase [Streptococcus equinus]KFN85526.1 tRNA threonylcarbamoyl adenosine modification protein [Streptococcus equinus ATCC 33317]
MANLEEILQSGGAVILPTETVYGLFAQAMNEDAVEHVYQLKRRPKEKAMNLNVADYETILAFSKNQPSYLKKIYDTFLPGPLTIILQANDRVPAWINSGLSTIGFRIPKHPQTLELIKKTGPLIGPSANISGQESGKIFADIKKQFGNSVTGLSDDVALTGVDSTILDLSGDSARILRQGAITKEELLACVPELTFAD